MNVCIPPGAGWRVVRAGEVPVPHLAGGVGGQLGALCAVLILHRAVPSARVLQHHRESALLFITTTTLLTVSSHSILLLHPIRTGAELIHR